MNISCSATPCPILLNSKCVIYEGANLVYTGIVTNDTLQTALEKIDAAIGNGGSGGGGTVTSFSSGNLSPLFTTSVANSTTTPALTFSLSNAAANTVYGNNTASSAAPGFQNSIYLSGNIRTEQKVLVGAMSNYTTPDGGIVVWQASNSELGYITPSQLLTFIGGGTGSVTNVSALTLGTTGTDLTSSVANSTTTPVITLNVPTASASNRGALSSTDWSTFNGKQATISVTSPITLTGASVGIVNQGTTTTVLHGNASGNATFGAVSNSDLTNSSITIGSTNIALGATSTTLSGLTEIIATGTSGNIINTSVTSGVGSSNTATNGTAVVGTATTGVGVQATATTGTGAILQTNSTTNPAAISEQSNTYHIHDFKNSGGVVSYIANNGSFSGTASTATNVAASGITGTTLASNVVTSSLTAVGTIGTGAWQGTAIADGYIGNNINATHIADGTVSSTEFQYINSLTSNAQTQLNTKFTNGGDSFGANAILGTNDNRLLIFRTNGIDWFSLSGGGNLAGSSWSFNNDGSGSNAAMSWNTTGKLTALLTYNTAGAASANGDLIDVKYYNDHSPTNAFIQGGNAFGANATIGTTDNYELSVISNSIVAYRVFTDGGLGGGGSYPTWYMGVDGAASFGSLGIAMGYTANFSTDGSGSLSATNIAWNSSGQFITNPLTYNSTLGAGSFSGNQIPSATWVLANSLSNPLTTQGDILYRNATVPARLAAGSSTQVLHSGTTPSWSAVSLTADVSGTLPVANGGTNASSASITAFNNITGYTAAGATGTTSTSLVFSTSPTLITPALGTPSALVGTNITGTASGLSIGGTAAVATTSTVTNITASGTYYPTFVSANTGNLGISTTSARMTFNPSNGVFSSSALLGGVTAAAANVAGLVAGNYSNTTATAASLDLAVSALGTTTSRLQSNRTNSNGTSGSSGNTDIIGSTMIGAALTEVFRGGFGGFTIPSGLIMSGTITSGAVVMTAPAASGTLATLAGTETLTNKSLTSPTVTGTLTGAISNWSGLMTVGTSASTSGAPTPNMFWIREDNTGDNIVSAAIRTTKTGTASSSTITGLNVWASDTHTSGTVSNLNGIRGYINSQGSAAITIARPLSSTGEVSGSSAISVYRGVDVSLSATAGTTVITDGVMFWGEPFPTSNITITNKYGVYINDETVINYLGGTTVFGKSARLKSYTVATLPASPTQGDMAAVTDALAPAFLTIIVGSGAVYSPVIYNGTNWIGF